MSSGDAPRTPLDAVERPAASEPKNSTADRSLATVLALAVSLRITVAQGVTLGVLGGLATLPIWVRSLRRYLDATTVTVLLGLAIVWGVVLTQTRQSTHVTSTENLVANSALLLTTFTLMGVLLWGKDVAPFRAITVTAGLGMFATAVVVGSWAASDNPWKTHFALPVSVMLLGLLHSDRRRWWSVAALGGLAGINAVLDSRSAFATCLLAAVLVASQRVWERGRSSVRMRAVGVLLVVVAVAGALYVVGMTLINAGYLGEEAKERSLAQEELSGSVIVGGRPEMAATWALMRTYPSGFGAGTMLNLDELLVAKNGMWSINYQPDNGYVENYMFGQTIKLHSVVGDLWAYFGLPGLALALFLIYVLVRCLVIRLAAGSAPGVTVFVVCTVLWNIPFGPLYAAAPMLGLALGLGLVPRTMIGSVGRGTRPGPGERSSPSLGREVLTGSHGSGVGASVVDSGTGPVA